MIPIIRPSPVFSPNALAPVRWYDGNNVAGTGVAPANGASIATWVGLSRMNINATQGTGANQPTFSAQHINNRGVLTFNGTSFNLVMGTNVALTGELTVFLVNNTDTTNANRMIIGSSLGSSSKIGIDAAGKLFIRIVNGGSSDNSVNYIGTGTNILTVQRNSAFKVDAAFNGNTFTRLFADAAQAGTFSVNRIGQDNSGFIWQGDIAEILIFDYALSTTQISQVRSYLSQKWGVTL